MCFEQPSGQSSRFSGHGSRDVEDETCSQPGSGQRYSEVFVATCHHHSGRQHQSKHCCASAAVLLEGSIESKKSHQWHLQCLGAKLAILLSLFTTAFNYAAEPFFNQAAKDKKYEINGVIAKAFTIFRRWSSWAPTFILTLFC